MDFNKRLKNIRKRANVTQKSVAEYLGITLRTYQRYEEGTIEPPLSKIVSISEYFDIPTDCLLCNGFFANWDEILIHKEEILLLLKEKILSFPSGFDTSVLTESQLAHILPAIFAKITFEGNEINVYPLVQTDMFPISAYADEH